MSDTPLEIRNPATGATVATVAAVAPEAVAALVARARAAQPAWEALGFAGRGRVLRRAGAWVVRHREELIAAIVSETGKTYEDALISEVLYAARAFRFWARRAPRYLGERRVRSASPLLLGRRLAVRYAPVGVVGVIGPWNYPLTNSFGDCIPALAAGNAVVLKPSELTPLTSRLLADGLRECGLPEDLLLVAPGGAATGAALVDAADMIMFTGSTATGRAVAQRAAQTLTPVALELGGKDPMIVLADADIERAAAAAAYYGIQNAGQTCISVERIYVEEPVYDQFLAALVRNVTALRVGAPGGPGSVDVGAITTPAQRELIARHVDDARAAGARVLCGGVARGNHYQPTVLADVDHSMACMTEETFGPTLPVARVADAEEAIARANDSRYGLAASVWTRSPERGAAIARRLTAGVVCVGDHQLHYIALELPIGGWKESGLGVRHGADGIRKFCRAQSLLITRWRAPGSELHFYPFRRVKTAVLARAIGLLYKRR